MSSVNLPNLKLDTTVKVFDQFYLFEQDVPVDQYDVVVSFFEQAFSDKLAAKNLAVGLFRVAAASKRSVLELLAEMKDKDHIKLTDTLCYYFNNQRSNTTLLGINAVIAPNYYAARNVLL